MMNLSLVKNQPRWRVAAVAAVAKLMGVVIHVEGVPFGSYRSRSRHPQKEVGDSPTYPGQAAGQTQA
jgi:hypothetical protein